METEGNTASPNLQRLTTRTGLLLTVCLCLLWALLILLPQDILVMRSISTNWGWIVGSRRAVPYFAPQLDPKLMTSADVPLGVTLPDTVIGKQIREAAPHKVSGYLVVFIGACSSCISNRVEDWQKQAKQRNLGYVMVASTTPDITVTYSLKNKITVPVISDPKETLFKQFNARWAGRPYLCSKDWKLVWQEDKMHIDFPLFSDGGFLKALEKERISK
ncbi:MAG: hypothetical protein NT023_02275 [Armatimonadetes bacterium]|nr:hypothetical protein [Armatimonadota bacterium]